MDDEALGPAFDSNTIGRPTPRKLVTCWMEQAGLPTVILPEVWDELTRVPRSVPVPPAVVQSWWHVRNLPDAPFAWVELDDDQKMVAVDVLNSFTAACFPRTPVDRIATLPDANIVAEAVAIGAEALVTGDINTIDHYEINGVLSKAFGRNREFVTTLDSALCRAHPCAEAAESLLTLALSTVAPVQSKGWGVDDAHEDLKRLQKALVGSNLTETSHRLETRWEHSRDLERVLCEAQRMARSSPALRVEQQRAQWLETSLVRPPPVDLRADGCRGLEAA